MSIWGGGVTFFLALEMWATQENNKVYRELE